MGEILVKAAPDPEGEDKPGGGREGGTGDPPGGGALTGTPDGAY